MQLLGQLSARFGLFVKTFLKGSATRDKKHSRSGFNEKVANKHKLDYLYKCPRSIRALLFLPSSQGNINECKTPLCRGAALNIKSWFGWISFKSLVNLEKKKWMVVKYHAENKQTKKACETICPLLWSFHRHHVTPTNKPSFSPLFLTSLCVPN